MAFRWKIPFLSQAVYSVWKLDAARKLAMIEDWIAPGQKLLEVGSGPGSVIEVFRAASHDVTGLDIADSSYSTELAPVVYDGENMPFADGEFAAATVLTTLHHTPQPDLILAEASRIARRVIVIEDVYSTRFQEFYTKLADKITNLEFVGHPHSNRTDEQWLESFERLGLKPIHRKIHRLAGLFQQAVYVLEPKQCSSTSD